MKHLSPRLLVRFSGRTSFALLAVGIAASVAALSSCSGGAEHCQDCTLTSDGGTFGGRAGTGGRGSAGTGALGGTNGSGTAGTGSLAGSGGHGGLAITGNAGSSGLAGTGGTTGASGRGGTEGGTAGSGGSNGGHGGAATGGAGATGGSVAGGGGAGAGGRGGAAGNATAGNGGAGGSGGGGMGGAALPPMVAYYPFESTLNDMSGNAKNGTAKGTTAVFGTGHIGHDLDINNMASGAVNYVALPANLLSSARAMTIAFWVRVRTDRTFARVFDFGTDNQSYMYFTTHETPSGNPRFGITTSSNTGEQNLVHTAAMKVATWYHVAITLGPNGGVLYVNGTQSVASTTMTLRPMSIGTTPNDWLGHSQWTQDPYFDGEIDELRIYSDVLTADQVRSVYMLN